MAKIDQDIGSLKADIENIKETNKAQFEIIKSHKEELKSDISEMKTSLFDWLNNHEKREMGVIDRLEKGLEEAHKEISILKQFKKKMTYILAIASAILVAIYEFLKDYIQNKILK